MISIVSKHIVNWLIHSGTVEQEDNELYEYAVTCTIINISPLLIMIILGNISGLLIESILIIIPFIFIRSYSGGFHSHSRLCCFIFSCLTLTGMLWMSTQIEIGIISTIVLILSCVGLIILSPIESNSHPINTVEKLYYKKCVIKYVLLFLVIYSFLLWLGEMNLAGCIMLGICLPACLQILCLILKIANMLKEYLIKN